MGLVGIAAHCALMLLYSLRDGISPGDGGNYRILYRNLTYNEKV
jgi:hypothetical protein